MIDFESIRITDALPRVFSSNEDTLARRKSDVWRTDLTFVRGNYYIIEAESGTGKSSLCSYIYGNRDDYEGHIYFGDRDIRTLSVRDWCDIRRHTIALLPQEMRLFPELTAFENVEIKNRLTHHLSKAQIGEMFELLEIPDKLNQPAALLSIGQQQRVAIIRALAQPFGFILLDEPVSHLDTRNNRIVAQLILAQARAQGAAVITTSVGNPLLIDDEYHNLAL